MAYDSDRLRSFVMSRGTLPVIPNNPARKRPQPFDKASTRTATSSSGPSAG
jgi:putative transposase